MIILEWNKAFDGADLIKILSDSGIEIETAQNRRFSIEGKEPPMTTENKLYLAIDEIHTDAVKILLNNLIYKS